MNKNHTELKKKLIAPYNDLLVISIVAVVVLIAAVYLGVFGMFLKLHNYLKAYKLDEIITVLIVLAFAFGIFSLRRWRELRDEIATSRSQEAEVRLLAQTVVSVKDCISITDMNDNIIFVNLAFVNVYGYTNEELVGKNISMVRSPNTPPEVTKQILPTTLTGEWHGELINRRKDGSDFPIELWASLVKDDDGNPVAMVGVARDITERKRAEEELHKKEHQQSLVLQSLPMVFYTANVTPEIATAWISEQVELITGYPPKWFTETTMFWQNRLHPNDRKKTLDKYYSVLKDEYAHTEYRWLCADGLYRWFSDHIVLIRDKQGNPKELVGIWRDITERKRAEEEIFYHSEFQKVIATISSNFVNIKISEVDEAIESALKILGEFVKVDRSYVFIFSDDGTKMNNTHEWCAEGIESQIKNLQGLPVEIFPWWMVKLRRFENIIIPSVANLPPEASAEKEILQSQDIKSLVVIPMISGNSLVGFLGFDSVRTECAWKNDEVSLLRIAGTNLANVLERRKLEEVIQNIAMQLSIAQEMSKIGSWDADLNTNIVTWSDQLYRNFGLEPEDCTPSLEKFVEFVNPDERRLFKNKIENALRDHKPFEFENRILQKDGEVRTLSAKGFVAIDASGEPTRMYGSAQDITERKQAEEEREKLVSELQSALANIKTLSGLIPICASCKKIRDDKGYWNQIEQYIIEHSDAKFTHGICPECTKKYYSDFKK